MGGVGVGGAAVQNAGFWYFLAKQYSFYTALSNENLINH